MPLGRKKSDSSKKDNVVIAAPPAITQYEFSAPAGDRYLTRQVGNKQISEATLNPLSQQTVQSSLQALQNLAQGLQQPDAQRVANIEDTSRAYYDLQADAINRASNTAFSQASADLGKRFGGTYNATFGTDLLSRMEKNRLGQLAGAAKDATLVGQDLYNQDEDNRIRRFQLFQNYLSDEYNKAQGAVATGSQILDSAAGRTQDLATTRAQLAAQNQARTDALLNQRMNIANSIASSIAMSSLY